MMGLPGSRSVFTASLIGAAFVAVLLFCTSPSHAKKRAIDDCGKAIEMNSKDAASYYNRGAAYANLGDYKSATEDYKAAARLGNADSQVILIISGTEW